MGEDGKVIYKVVIDDSGVETEAEAAGRKAGDGVDRGSRPGAGMFKEVMIGAARAIGQAFVEMTAKAVQGVEQIARAGIEFNAKMESYQTAFTTLLKDGDEAARVMAQIREDAARTPFDVDSLTQANQMLISTGMSAEDARKDVLNLANAVAGTSGGSAELARMAANMQQIKNVGKATAMDVRQFAMAGINIYGLLADATGKTTKEVKEMEVSYDLLSEALARASEEGGMYAGAMEAQSQTFQGRISTLKDNAMLLAGSLTEDLFNQLSTTALPMVIGWVDTLLTAAETGGIEGAIAAAKDILSTLISQFLDGLPEMVDTGLTVLEGLLSGLADNMDEVVYTALHVILILINGLLDHLPELAVAGVNLLLSVIAGIIQALPEIIAAAGKAVKALWDTFFNTDWSSVGENIINGIWAGFTGLWDWFVSQVTNALNWFWEECKREMGIHSPSTKFAYIGEMSVKGTEIGFEEEAPEMTRVVRDIYSGVSDTAVDALRPVDVAYNGYGREDIEQQISYTLSATGTTGGATIIVPLSLDGREIARATAWSMGEQLAWEEL